MFLYGRKCAKKYKTTYRLWAMNIGGVNIVTPEDTEASFRKINREILILSLFYR